MTGSRGDEGSGGWVRVRPTAAAQQCVAASSDIAAPFCHVNDVKGVVPALPPEELHRDG